MCNSDYQKYIKYKIKYNNLKIKMNGGKLSDGEKRFVREHLIDFRYHFKDFYITSDINKDDYFIKNIYKFFIIVNQHRGSIYNYKIEDIIQDIIDLISNYTLNFDRQNKDKEYKKFNEYDKTNLANKIIVFKAKEDEIYKKSKENLDKLEKKLKELNKSKEEKVKTQKEYDYAYDDFCQEYSKKNKIFCAKYILASDFNKVIHDIKKTIIGK